MYSPMQELCTIATAALRIVMAAPMPAHVDLGRCSLNGYFGVNTVLLVLRSLVYL